jgi:hypothetical protein
MTTEEVVSLLLANGFTDGWVVTEGKIVIWENEENPPSPLIRPEA